MTNLELRVLLRSVAPKTQSKRDATVTIYRELQGIPLKSTSPFARKSGKLQPPWMRRRYRSKDRSDVSLRFAHETWKHHNLDVSYATNMNHASNSKPPADLGWKVIDQALDDLQRSASRAKTWNEFAAALSNALPPLGIACWPTWRQGGNGWICNARSPESLHTNSNEVELVVKAARLLSDRESDERTPTHVSDTSEQRSADAITSPASRSCTILQRVAVPFRPESSIDGVFIACFASDVREDTGRARIGLLNAIVDLVAQFELRRAFRDQQVAASAKNSIDDLQRRIHSSLRLHQIALLLAHDGRIALGCDRVIVTVTRRGHQCVEAVTGVDKPSRASLSLRALASLCEYVASSGERLTFISPQDNAQDSPAHWPETFVRELCLGDACTGEFPGADIAAGRHESPRVVTSCRARDRKRTFGESHTWVSPLDSTDNEICSKSLAYFASHLEHRTRIDRLHTWSARRTSRPGDRQVAKHNASRNLCAPRWNRGNCIRRSRPIGRDGSNADRSSLGRPRSPNSAGFRHARQPESSAVIGAESTLTNLRG